MKKLFILYLISIALIVIACSVHKKQSQESSANKAAVAYKDGIYTGSSRSSYTSEPYWGIVSLRIKKGSFTDINFIIRDSSLHETFNEKYEGHFKGNELYIQQCRNDWKGVQTYPVKLSETQDPARVDGISGATWSYNIFQASVKEALKNAGK